MTCLAADARDNVASLRSIVNAVVSTSRAMNTRDSPLVVDASRSCGPGSTWPMFDTPQIVVHVVVGYVMLTPHGPGVDTATFIVCGVSAIAWPQTTSTVVRSTSVACTTCTLPVTGHTTATP